MIINDDTNLSESGFFWREKNGVKVLVCKELEEHGFRNGFSTRLGGVSPFPSGDLNLAGFDEDSNENIFENRKRFLETFEDEFTLTSVWQVHGDGVKVVKNAEDVLSTIDKFDGLVSMLPKVLIGVKTADCVPVLIGDPKTNAFAAVHAGWRGTVESIVSKAIDRMTAEYGSDPMDLVCAIGPAAGCANYEIGRDVIDAFAERFSDSVKLFKETRPGHALIDLHVANRDQLTAKGVELRNIFTAPFCTMERTDLFFSYRVEKKKFGKTGRLMSVIGRKN
ncbi:MAG: peptidoglycan editing factor PgeF [Pyrinomonadaceae bacterium]